MLIELINHTANPEAAIILATRTCYQSFDKQAEASDQRILEHIVKNDESPLEFANFTFLISGISRVTSHQLVRHRMASYAQKSQRYCGEEYFNYVVPPSIENNTRASLEFLRCMEEIRIAYQNLKAIGIKSEDARYLLPNACQTELVCQMNARSLRHFLRLRMSPKAQWEIREVAYNMYIIVRNIAPTLVYDINVEPKLILKAGKRPATPKGLYEYQKFILDTMDDTKEE